MFRFKLSAIFLSLMARVSLSEPVNPYSILDESSNRWLPDDTFLEGLNTLYNSLSQGLQDKDDKKKRPSSIIVAAIIEYLSTDLADEQSKLNSFLNELSRNFNSKLKNEFDSARNKKINRKYSTQEAYTRGINAELDSRLKSKDNGDKRLIHYESGIILDKDKTKVNNNDENVVNDLDEMKINDYNEREVIDNDNEIYFKHNTINTKQISNEESQSELTSSSESSKFV